MKVNFSALAKCIRRTAVKHTPEILISLGIVGMGTAIVTAVKVTPKALDLIEEKKDEKGEEKLTVLETVQTTWKCYIPTAVATGVSIACIVGANSVNTKRNAALMAAYTLSETALKEYQDKTIEIVGDGKEETIRNAIARDKLMKDPVENREIIPTRRGDTLCYETMTGRYFKSDMDALKKIENELNRRILVDDLVTLSDLYYEIGLNNTIISDSMGWRVDDGYIRLMFSSQLATDGTPCLVLDYAPAPSYFAYK